MMRLYMALQIELLAGAVVTAIMRTFIQFLLGVRFDMSFQQSLAIERLITLRPLTSVSHSLGVLLNIVVTQVRLAVK